MFPFEDIAKMKVSAELLKHDLLTEDEEKRLVISHHEQNDTLVYWFFVPRQHPNPAFMVAKATADRASKHVEVKIFNMKRR